MKLFKREPKLTFIPNYNDFFFEELGVSREKAMRLFEDVANQIATDIKDADVMYRPAWCALKLSGFKPETILELGTYRGYSTVFMAMLWPQSKIYTVDLPPGDPLFYKWTPEPEHQIPQLTDGSQKNIVIIQRNTMHLLQEDGLPGFDLIFIDAGHNFPTVAFDHFYSLHKLKPGGWLFSDDVTPPFDPVNEVVKDIWKTIEFINARQKEQFRFLLQRESLGRWELDAKRGTRKYIGYMKKCQN